MRVFEGFEGWGFLRVLRGFVKGFKFCFYDYGSHVILMCPYSSQLPINIQQISKYTVIRKQNIEYNNKYELKPSPLNYMADKTNKIYLNG